MAKTVLLPFVIAALLGLLAVGIIVSVIVISRLRQISFRQAARGFVSSLWAVPVIAVLILVAGRALPELGLHAPQQPPTEASPLSSQDVVLGEATEAASSPAARSSRAAESAEPPSDPASRNPQPSSDSSDHPDWVNREHVEKNGRTLVVLSSGQYVTEKEAEDNALQQAVSLLRTDLHQKLGYEGEWTLPAEVVRKEAVRLRNVEEVERVIGGNPVQMHRVHLQVELSDEVRETIAETVWRPQIVERRLWSLGSLVGMMVLVVAALAVYLRMDASTGGIYRRRLKLAAVLLIVAGGLLAAVAADQQLLADAGQFLDRR